MHVRVQHLGLRRQAHQETVNDQERRRKRDVYVVHYKSGYTDSIPRRDERARTQKRPSLEHSPGAHRSRPSGRGTRLVAQSACGLGRSLARLRSSSSPPHLRSLRPRARDTHTSARKMRAAPTATGASSRRQRADANPEADLARRKASSAARGAEEQAAEATHETVRGAVEGIGATSTSSSARTPRGRPPCAAPSRPRGRRGSSDAGALTPRRFTARGTSGRSLRHANRVVLECRASSVHTGWSCLQCLMKEEKERGWRRGCEMGWGSRGTRTRLRDLGRARL